MKKSLPLAISLVLLLAGCVDKTGLSAESSKPPLGNANAAVIVEEFGDVQCPACKAAHTQITKPLEQQYGSQVAIVFRHFPLRSSHRYAQMLAEAAECAADQGKFWEFLDIAYANQTTARPPIANWGAELQLDMDLLNRCQKSHIKKDTIQADYEAGQKAGVQGTPTYFVNGKKVDSNLAAISQAIDEAMKNVQLRL